jgi:hypothetical protein
MAAPFWRSLPGPRLICPLGATVTVCVVLMRDNLGSASGLRKWFWTLTVTNGQRRDVSGMQSNAKDRAATPGRGHRQCRTAPGRDDS